MCSSNCGNRVLPVGVIPTEKRIAAALGLLNRAPDMGCHARSQVLALGDMGASVGDLQAFRDTAEDETFAHDLPAFPVERKKAAAPSFLQRGEVWISRLLCTLCHWMVLVTSGGHSQTCPAAHICPACEGWPSRYALAAAPGPVLRGARTKQTARNAGTSCSVLRARMRLSAHSACQCDAQHAAEPLHYPRHHGAPYAGAAAARPAVPARLPGQALVQRDGGLHRQPAGRAAAAHGRQQSAATGECLRGCRSLPVPSLAVVPLKPSLHRFFMAGS